jgi:hypothetical protein
VHPWQSSTIVIGRDEISSKEIIRYNVLRRQCPPMLKPRACAFSCTVSRHAPQVFTSTKSVPVSASRWGLVRSVSAEHTIVLTVSAHTHAHTIRSPCMRSCAEIVLSQTSLLGSILASWAAPRSLACLLLAIRSSTPPRSSPAPHFARCCRSRRCLKRDMRIVRARCARTQSPPEHASLTVNGKRPGMYSAFQKR